jgi:hypothetical protein
MEKEARELQCVDSSWAMKHFAPRVRDLIGTAETIW